MILDSLSNFFEVIFYLIYFSTFGILIQLFFIKKKINISSIPELNIYGILFHYLLISSLNFIFPLNLLSSYILLINILLIIFIFFKKNNVKKIYYRNIISHSSLLFIFLIWISNLGNKKLLYEPIYYIQNIRWAQQYPIVKGLANLFDHFGFDSGHFLHLAILDSFPFIYRAFWNFSGYLLSIGFYYFFIIPIIKIFNQKSIVVSDIMKLLFIPIFINNCFYMHPGIGTDLPVFIFGSILSIEIFKMFFESKKNIGIIITCLILGFISKMSFLPIMIILIITLFLYMLYKNKNIFNQSQLIILLSICSLLIQINRNTILSGYPFYPISSISAPVQWKLDQENVLDLSERISRWAQGLHQNETNPEEIKIIKNEWIKSRLFLQHRRVETLYPIILGILGLLFMVFHLKKQWIIIVLFFLPPLVQMFLWYFYVPDTRFSSFSFWWFGAGSFCHLLKYNLNNIHIKFLSVVIIIVAFSIHVIDSLGQKKELMVFEKSNYKPINPLSNLVETKSGLNVWVPINEQKCDDSPLPCTQWLNMNLELIIPGKIESGFKINK
tara:strand:+ start:1338 stop:2999 length:1662 start_codon:yes stop_codon:yes gene_type:complete